MVKRTLCCLVVLAFLACVDASAQHTAQRQPVSQRTPPPAAPPARDTAPPTQPKTVEANKAPKLLRPEGSKPISLETAQKETARLTEAIAKYEQRLAEGKAKGKDAAEPTAAGKSAATAKAAATEKPPTAEKKTATEKSAAGAHATAKTSPAKAGAAAGPAEAAPRKKPTVATVEAENKVLRRKLDKLLLQVAAQEGTVPAGAPGQPAYDPHIVDRPNNMDFHPGKTLDELEYSAICSGRLIAEVGDEVVYEWALHFSDDKRTQYVTHQIWVQAKDGVATNLTEGNPGVPKKGPPPKTPL
jgi:hypothetical protein